MNSSIRKEMNRRYALLKRAQSNPKNPDLWKQYRRQRNHVTKLMRDAEALYWKDKFENANSSGDFLRVVREMQGKAKPSVRAIRNENENIIINAKDKAESYNQFFSTVGEKLADVIIPDNSFNIFHHIYKVSPTIEPLKINFQKIKRAFDKCVKPGKGSGPDNLSARGLKLGGDAVAVGLSYVMEVSSKTSSHPSQRKLSKVRAVPKKGNSSERGDFRPISLLNIPSKVYKGVIGEAIDCHFINGGISSQSQWGFKSGRLTEFLMLHLTETWRQELEKNRTVGIWFIDFKKAFDSICHKTMALKLQASGILGSLYNLIIDYLSGRKRYVEIEGLRSTEADVRFGVPQGSILGPRLFSMSMICLKFLAVEIWKCLLMI